MHPVVRFARTAVSRQHRALAAARIADGAGAFLVFAQQNRQPVPQLCIVRRRIDGDADLAQESRVKDALMGLTIGRDKTGTVDGEDDVLIEQVDVVDDLVIGAL